VNMLRITVQPLMTMDLKVTIGHGNLLTIKFKFYIPLDTK